MECEYEFVIVRSFFSTTALKSRSPKVFSELYRLLKYIIVRSEIVRLEHKLKEEKAITCLMANSGISGLGMMLGTAYQDYVILSNNDEADSTPDAFEKVLGHKLTSLSDAIKELM